jgi:hypothetical protein
MRKQKYEFEQEIVAIKKKKIRNFVGKSTD